MSIIQLRGCKSIPIYKSQGYIGPGKVWEHAILWLLTGQQRKSHDAELGAFLR